MQATGNYYNCFCDRSAYDIAGHFIKVDLVRANHHSSSMLDRTAYLDVPTVKANLGGVAVEMPEYARANVFLSEEYSVMSPDGDWRKPMVGPTLCDSAFVQTFLLKSGCFAVCRAR